MKKGYILIVTVVLLLLMMYFNLPEETGKYILRCIDTDDGKNYYEYGYAYKHNSTILPDRCFGYRLREAYCKRGIVLYELVDCEQGCYKGACLMEAYPCMDSDDGKDYYEAGIVSKFTEGKFQDSCIMNILLKEYYCKSNKIRKIWYMCPNGCEGNSCR